MEITNKEIMKRNLYNKLDSLVKNIKTRSKLDLEQKEKERIIKMITLVIITFQFDNLYSETLDKSGIVCILKMFGIDEFKAEKIKSKLNKGINICLLSLLIFKNLK